MALLLPAGLTVLCASNLRLLKLLAAVLLLPPAALAIIFGFPASAVAVVGVLLLVVLMTYEALKHDASLHGNGRVHG